MLVSRGRSLSLARLIEADRNSGGTRDPVTRDFRRGFLSFGEIFMETRTRVPTYARVLCLAARLTLNFVAPSLWRTHLRVVRYASLYRLLFRTSGLGCVPIIPDTWISLISAAEYFKTPVRYGPGGPAAAGYDFSTIFYKFIKFVDPRLPHSDAELFCYSRQLRNNSSG